MGMMYERIADGRRRFFPVPGSPTAVFLRDKRGHHDRGLELGRDYELEPGGVSLRRVPAAGETVIILAGVKSMEQNAEKYPVAQVVATTRETQPSVQAIQAASRVANPVSDHWRPLAPSIDEAVASGDLMALKDLLTLAARDTCEGMERTAEWQDEFARLTAVMRGAPDIEGVQAAFRGIETFLLGGAE